MDFEEAVAEEAVDRPVMVKEAVKAHKDFLGAGPTNTSYGETVREHRWNPLTYWTLVGLGAVAAALLCPMLVRAGLVSHINGLEAAPSFSASPSRMRCASPSRLLARRASPESCLGPMPTSAVPSTSPPMNAPCTAGLSSPSRPTSRAECPPPATSEDPPSRAAAALAPWD
jgi:hypothetical protein